MAHEKLVYELVRKALPGIANDLVNELVRVAPVDTGFLRNSIRQEVNGDVITIHFPDYALYIEFGTNPHEIRAINTKALHWKKDGKDFFAKVVHHPGTEPNPFIRSTLNTHLLRIVYDNIKRQAENVNQEPA